jgi:signal transduction histidine kinase
LASRLLSNGIKIRMIPTALIQYRAILARQQLLHQQQNQRLARRIHDGISQHLTLLTLQLSLAQASSAPPADWPKQCQQWAATVLALGQNLREIMNEIRPRILDELGFAAALQSFTRSRPKGIECHLFLPEAPVTLAPAAANELFAICHDVVHEVFAPNGVTVVTIAVEQSHEALRLHLSTDQKNPELAALASQALDSLSVHERLFCVDGSVEVLQNPDLSLTITLSLPASLHPVAQAA